MKKFAALQKNKMLKGKFVLGDNCFSSKTIVAW